MRGTLVRAALVAVIVGGGIAAASGVANAGVTGCTTTWLGTETTAYADYGPHVYVSLPMGSYNIGDPTSMRVAMLHGNANYVGCLVN